MAKTCPASPYSEVLPRDVGSITFQQLMLIIACGCLLLTTVISSMLVYKHLTRYTRPNEQRQMVRIVVTPIVFGVLSVFSLAWYEAAQYLNPIELYYEAIALASLFLLFVEYVKPERESKESFFYQAQPNKDLTLVVGLCCFPCLKVILALWHATISSKADTITEAQRRNCSWRDAQMVQREQGSML